MKRTVRLMAALPALAAVLLAGCSTSNDPSSAAAEPSGNLVAPMRGIGSAATGKVIVVDNGTGVTLTLNAANLIQGTYRLAFHENPYCTASRNATATGPAWGPGDSGKPPGELIPLAYAGQVGEIYFTARIPGVHVDGTPSLRGRSIVLHWGNSVDGLFPGSSNNYIACGVFNDSEPGLLDTLIK